MKPKIPVGTESYIQTLILGIQTYFHSGWAFLVPYLAAYQVYHWTRGPVHEGSELPALTQVFDILHITHLLLAIIGLSNKLIQAESSRSARILSAIALGGLFALPGTYLEWPADPWEHWRRTTEWEVHPTLGEHSARYKAFYFLTYSILGHYVISPNLFSLASSIACCLVAWQYYRLGVACGLSRRESQLFVAVNILASGVSIFSAYRYYSASTSLYAQVAAVAILRIIIERITSPNKDTRTSRLLSNALSISLLAAIIAFNHVQGFAIAGLSIMAALLWKLTDSPKRAIVAGAGLVFMSALALLLTAQYRDATPQLKGWLAWWGGFDLGWDSPAGKRIYTTLGAFGIIEIFCACWLAKRREITGWLVAGPFLLLLLPIVAIPVVTTIASSNSDDLAAVGRLLFAIPVGMSIVRAGAIALRKMPSLTPIFIILPLALVVTIPQSSPYFNRSWNLLVVPPADLRMQQAIEPIKRVSLPTPTPGLLTTESHRFLWGTASPRYYGFLFRKRTFRAPPSAFLEALEISISHREGSSLVVAPQPISLFTPGSASGYLSGHWLPHQCALDFAGGTELYHLANSLAAEESAANPRVFHLR